MNNEEVRALYEKMRVFVKDKSIPIITAKQPPYPPGYRRPPPPVSDVIIIDYLDLIRK
jgi:hypothetical protein